MKKGLFLLLATWMLASAGANGANAQVLDTVPVLNVTSENIFDGAYVTYQDVERLCDSSKLAMTSDVVELLCNFFTLGYQEEWFHAAVRYLVWLESDEPDEPVDQSEYGPGPMVVVFRVINDSYNKFVIFSWGEDILKFAILSEDGLWVIDTEEVPLSDDWNFLISGPFISLIRDSN